MATPDIPRNGVEDPKAKGARNHRGSSFARGRRVPHDYEQTRARGAVGEGERVDPFRFMLVIAIAIPVVIDACLLAAYLLMLAARSTALEGISLDLVRGFEFSNESNIPTWASSLLWAGLGVTGLSLALLARRHRLSFALLGIVTLYASLDEIAELHERLEAVGTAVLPDSMASFSAAWVIPGLILALGVGLLLLRMVLSLPARARNGIFAGGIVFLAGAIGVETITSLITHNTADQFSLLSIGLSVIEENLEMIGVGIALAALLSLARITRDAQSIRIDIDRDLAGQY